MATVYEIPVTPAGGNQTFSVELNSVTYRLALTWRNAKEAGWVLDISDASGNAIVNGIPLVTGADLLAPYKHLAIGGGGSLTVITDGDAGAVPTFANLGLISRLYWTPPA